MHKQLTAAIAAFAMLGGTALATDHHLWMEDAEAQAEIRTWTQEQAVDPWTPPAGTTMEPGQALPPDAQTHTFMGFEAYPEAEGFEYVVVDGTTVIVDAETREIVSVID